MNRRTGNRQMLTYRSLAVAARDSRTLVQPQPCRWQPRLSLLPLLLWLFPVVLPGSHTGVVRAGLPTFPAVPDALSDCQAALQTGDYARCLELATAAFDARSYGEEWPILKARAELALGKYPEALASVVAGIERYSWSIRLQQLRIEAALANGQRDVVTESLREVEKLASTASWRYTDADDLACLGQVALLLGADPKAVQEGFFERARRNYPNRPEGFVAAARLALDKGDPAFAAELLKPVLQQFPDSAEILFLYSEALSSADASQSQQLLTQALQKNPHLFAAQQRIAEQQIDAEDYVGAEQTLQQMLSVNPHLPEAHALRAVIFHLQGNSAAETESRAAALKFSISSPEPDHLIGTRLSRKYRFAEGAAAQRRALEADPTCNKARTQLAQDLLRLGQITEGWQLAEEAGKADQYNTTLFNLLQLKDSLGQYTTVRTEHFEIRMERGEAALYGPRVGQLLEEAWQQFTVRYQFQSEVPVTVEIYQRADDFAVRTFGIPEVSGFLGVCFGRVVTANSPASRRDSPVSWESVLWHEFCHVISLQKTANRIPRWLSEGISVYEERIRDPRWGQRMTPEFRQRIRDGKAVPIGQLSSAFLQAGSGGDLNFAYFESSLAVEHLVTVHGLPALNAVLDDLRSGVLINDALGRHCGGLESLQASFEQFLRQQADQLAPQADFSEEPLQALRGAGAAGLAEFCQQHPGHVPALLLLALQQLDAKDVAAEQTLQRVVQLYPEDASVDGARTQLAKLYRERGDTAGERRMLTEHLQRSADDVQSALRLQELCVTAQEWPDVIRCGQWIFAADPFRAEVQERLVQAGQATGDVAVVAAALQCLLQLQPDDAARLNFRLAQLWRESQPAEARRRVLMALEQSPRYREAHQLLLSLQPSAEAAPAPAPQP